MKAALRAFCAMLPFCAAATPGAPDEVRVEITRFAFSPREITIAPGTSVTWINRDETIHDVVGPKGAFKSAGMDTDDRFTFHFDTEGDFTYVCALHPHMTGTIHVHAR